MSEDFSENIKKQSFWIRILFMVGFMVAIYVTGVILLVLVIAQALFSLFTGEDNVNLRRLGANLAKYVHEILEFLTYNTETRPFPISPFPLVEEGEFQWVATSSAAKTDPAAKKASSTTRKASASGVAAKKKSNAKRSTAKKSPPPDTGSTTSEPGHSP
jgi:hypothetical protein